MWSQQWLLWSIPESQAGQYVLSSTSLTIPQTKIDYKWFIRHQSSIHTSLVVCAAWKNILYWWKMWWGIKFGSLAVVVYNCQNLPIFLLAMILGILPTLIPTNILAIWYVHTASWSLLSFCLACRWSSWSAQLLTNLWHNIRSDGTHLHCSPIHICLW